jgi:hypothetical protein
MGKGSCKETREYAVVGLRAQGAGSGARDQDKTDPATCTMHH